MNDAVDSALDSEDIEEEIEEEVDKVLSAIAGETASQLPDAVRKERIKQPSTSEAVEEVGRASQFLAHFGVASRSEANANDEVWRFCYAEKLN